MTSSLLLRDLRSQRSSLIWGQGRPRNLVPLLAAVSRGLVVASDIEPVTLGLDVIETWATVQAPLRSPLKSYWLPNKSLLNTSVYRWRITSSFGCLGTMMARSLGPAAMFMSPSEGVQGGDTVLLAVGLGDMSHNAHFRQVRSTHSLTVWLYVCYLPVDGIALPLWSVCARLCP